MKELCIHTFSRLLYSDIEQTFVYVGDSLEVAMFCNDGVFLEQECILCQKNDLFLLEEQHAYSFHVLANTTILLTKVPSFEGDVVFQFVQNTIQHEDIASLCVQIANQQEFDKVDALLLQSYVYKLSYLILNNFSYRGENLKKISISPYQSRVKDIHEFIYTNSNEDISLGSLATYLHLTPQYVSQLFKEQFGCTFLHYVANIRLRKALYALQHTSDSFLSIAMEYGFANIRSFQTTFMNVMHCTPKQYRKKLQQRDTFEQVCSDDPIFQRFMENHQDHLSLMKQEEKIEHYHVTLDAKAKEKKLIHTWRKLVTVGRARLLLIDDIRKQLSEVQKDIGFEMIRFHGIFNDDMHIYDEDDLGNSIYNFHQVNDILDFLLNIGLRPFVEIGFMPKKLALDPEIAIIDRIFIVSPPKDIKKWQDLVQAFLKNCINRYGDEEVSRWNFEFWNNSGLDYDENESSRARKFWQGTLDDYFAFYQKTYEAIKEVNPALRIGGPSCSIRLLHTFPKNMTKYLQFMKKHNCMIDFATFHVYPSYQGNLAGSYTTELPPFKDRIDTIQKWMKKQNLDVPIHITEWSTWGYKHQINFNDECAKALYLIQSMISTLDQVESLGHWTCSDYTETMNKIENNIFNDSAGLLTSNGIKKAAYHAYTCMRKLGDIQLSKGENYIFTRKKKNYQLLLYQYFNESKEVETTLSFKMKLKDMPNGIYEKKITYLNKESGSAYDIWNKMGARLEIMEEDVVYLKASSLMSYTRETIEIEHNEYEEVQEIRTNEAICIEFIYKYQ